MATSGDIRDIMDLGHDGPRQTAPKKKKKLLETQPRLSGMSREVQALMGDSVPPVAIVETPKYKQKPSLAMKMFKPRHWEEKIFVHGARQDGLQLKHWKRSMPGTNVRTPAMTSSTSMDIDMSNGGDEMPAVTEMRFEDEFPSEKWNVQAQVKQYDDEQYERYFKSEQWTKEETDYMIQLCKTYDLRWLLIADRYDSTEIVSTLESEDASQPAYPDRKMEEIKQRYYSIAAKMLELQTPASTMTQTEFQLWEKMRNFDARTEIQRKAMAEKLFERTKEEADEEKVLLEELYRITKNEEDLIKMRKELYSRLETAPSLRRNERGEEPSTALYQTSQGLSMLLSSLLAKEKRLKPRVPTTGPDTGSTAQTPTDTQKSRHGPQYSRRETMDSNAGDDHGPPSKKGSISQAPVVRTLTPAEEVKFGVSHPQERLTSGVMFRHEKINRLTMAKSQVQTQKIGAALTELSIPARLLMPTERVCREFERLVSEVQILLDTRRVLEKVSSEVKVLEEQKRLRLGGVENGEVLKENHNGADAMELDNDAAVRELQDKAGIAPAARDGVNPVLNGNGYKPPSSTQITGINGQRKAGEEIDDSQVQDDEDDDENDDDNEVDQSAVADEDDDEDADIDPSYARHDDEDEEEDGDQDEEDDDDNEVILGEDEDEEDDDAPGLDDLERAHQITDDEDDDGNDNDVDQSQLAEDEEDEPGDNDDDDQAEVDESMLNGADDEEEEDEEEENEADEGEDEENEEDEEDEAVVSRPVSSHSNLRAHKRSASAVSDASRTGSNRSGASRKKRK